MTTGSILAPLERGFVWVEERGTSALHLSTACAAGLRVRPRRLEELPANDAANLEKEHPLVTHVNLLDSVG